ncbi:MAG TPA: FAD-dependent oxidoreductase [Acidimicrobiia bacterium]|nr:FAD-dependent oxidoreductase [Acidimicrobiia bacterium]
MSQPPRSVVVVGAGLAGMTAAITAADEGARVTVLEARAHPGGRARTATTADGFHFNQGAHALYRGGAAWEVLHGFGITPRGASPIATRAYGLRTDGTLDELPGTFTTLLRTRVLGVPGKLQLLQALARPARMATTVTPGTSVQQWIDGTTRRTDVRSVLALLGRISNYCGDLDALDAAAGVAQMVQAFTHGVVYLDDGWQQLVDELRQLAAARDITVHTRAKVAGIEPHADGVTVRSAQGVLTADAVVLASGGPRDVDTLVRGASAAVHRWAADERPVVATTLDVALRTLPVPDRRITCGLDEPTYFSVHTPYAHLAHGDAGGEVAHLLWYGEADVDPLARLEWLLDRAQPGWHEQVVDWRHGRRLVVAHGRPLPGRGLRGRPPVAVPDLARVYVAGDWVGPDGMLADAAFASGRAAGRAAATAPAMVTA